MKKRLLWLMLALAACAPAQPPPLLDATPGAGVVVTEDSYRNAIFSARYPAGWRIITSEASQPPSVIFAAPGNCALIVISSVAIDQPPTAPACEQPGIQSIAQTVTLGSIEIALAGSAPAAEWDSFLTRFEQVAASLEASP